MKIYSDDGKEFISVDECNAYEAGLKLKKEKEEMEGRLKEEVKNKIYERIELYLEDLNRDVKEYENLTDEKLSYITRNGTLEIQKANKHLGNGFYTWVDFFQ